MLLLHVDYSGYQNVRRRLCVDERFPFKEKPKSTFYIKNNFDQHANFTSGILDCGMRDTCVIKWNSIILSCQRQVFSRKKMLN